MAQPVGYPLGHGLGSELGHTSRFQSRQPVVSYLEAARRTFIGLLLGNRNLDSNAWLIMLCRGRVTRWDTWIGSEPRYTIWVRLGLVSAYEAAHCAGVVVVSASLLVVQSVVATRSKW